MFEGEPWKNPFLNENYDKVCNIFYISKINIIQGQKIYYTKNFTSNLIDIEVVYINNESISGRLLVEGEQTIDTLCNSIKDMLDIFPKLNGLDRLVVTNLQKKEENNELVELIMDNQIKNHIKQKDVIYFDLIFSDVWIDVTMTLKDNDDESKTNKISFELKIQMKNYKKELETTLANLGIRTWKQLKEQEQEQDYYLLSNLNIISENNITDCKSKQVRTSKKNVMDFSNSQNFDFNNKITCSLTFINFTNYIYSMAIEEVERRNKLKKNLNYFEENKVTGDQKMNVIKFFFNNHFKSLYFDKTKNKNIIEIDKILCKLSPEYKNQEEEEEMNNFHIFYSTNNSPIYSQRRFIGPLVSRISEGKKDIEMDIFDYSEKSNNQNKTINNDNSFSDSYKSIKSDEDSDVDDRNYEIEEINFIKNEIDFEKEIDKFNPYMLISSFDESDIYRTRNLNFLDGEILKYNKINVNKELYKKITKDVKNNLSINEGEYSNHLIKKYAVVFLIIVLLIVLFKIIF